MKKEKKIIYINGRFLTKNITGVQRYAIEVVKQLDKIESNYDFVILAPKQGIIQNLELKNIQIINIGKFTGHLWEQVSLPFYILIHNRNSKLLNMCNLAPILYPGYIVIHDIAFKTHPEHLGKKFSLWYRFITRVNIKRYKHIFTVSNFSKNEIIKNYNIDANKITVTYNSAEHLKEIQPDESIIKKLKLENKEFCFSLGSKSPHKNHQFIVECAKRNSDILFVVSGNENKRIFKDKNNEEETENLVYTGYLNDGELVTLYKNCKAFIFPSLYEGFGIPPLEAMTLGCKNIILSNIEVFKEIYGDNAKYIELEKDNKYDIVKILNKNNMIHEDSIIYKYSWDKVTDSIVEILQKKG